MSICPIEKLIQFDLLDDCIHTPAGYYHFYRYYPPNTDIMTEEEKKAEIEQMTQLFDTLAREIAIFATDKIEDMSEIKRFYKNLAPEYDHLTSDIIAAIESTESRNSAAVQRAFYFIIRTDKQEESVYNQIAGKGYHINKAQREELAVLLRNYYLRECALPGFVDSKNEEKTERNAGYLVVSHSGGGMLRQGTRKGIRRTPANRGMRAHWVVKGLDISEDVCHGMCP